MDTLIINPENVAESISKFIHKQFSEAGFKNAVIGLSGGIDSSTVAYLAQRALGKENVWGINMPYRTSSIQSADDAKLVASELGINHKTIEITDMVDAYFRHQPDASQLRRGNMMARQRMAVLYDQSSALQALVLGCGNKTELLLGYCTLHGDTACAMLPIGGLYKTQVRILARYLGVPKGIIEKTPTADLWPGQSDEAELGFTYSEVDKLLYLMMERNHGLNELRELGFAESFIEKVSDKINKAKYKRCLPIAPQINQDMIHK